MAGQGTTFREFELQGWSAALRPCADNYGAAHDVAHTDLALHAFQIEEGDSRLI